MSAGNSGPPTIETYYTGKSGARAKTRMALWAGGALSLLITLPGTKLGFSSLVFTVPFVLLLCALGDLLIMRGLKDGKVALTASGIESQLLSGAAKYIAWADVSSQSMVSERGSWLQFQLILPPGRKASRDFWTGARSDRASLPLERFEPADRERIVDSVQRHLTQRGPAGAGAWVNPLTEERRFRERLAAHVAVPVVTYGLIGINVAVWLAMAASGAGVVQIPADKLLDWGGNAASQVQRGEWWRLLTSTFLHGGLVHVTMNMVGLAGAGILVERIYGHALYLLIYLSAGLLGSALSLHFGAQNVVSVGASGAIFGVMGALLTGLFLHRAKLPRQTRRLLTSWGTFVVYSLAQGLGSKGIDNAAHIGGLMAGCLLAWILPRPFDPETGQRDDGGDRGRAFVGAVLVLAGVAGLMITAPPAAVDLKRVFESRTTVVEAMNDFEAIVKAVQHETQEVKAGRMTEREVDERTRTVYAPRMQAVKDKLATVVLAPSDPRNAILPDFKRATDLTLEALQMPSVYDEGSDKPHPADPAREAAIEAELKQVVARIQNATKSLKATQKP